MVFGNAVFTYTNCLPSVASSALAAKPALSAEEALEQEEDEWQKQKFETTRFSDSKFYDKKDDEDDEDDEEDIEMADDDDDSRDFVDQGADYYMGSSGF
mmetsp:Transcript_23741/g.27300  ORF Transcript_23741/g.27300 Transcript_23741/m.27300 type:complete len:99 (+) Transcript_23741:17-313(+)